MTGPPSLHIRRRRTRVRRIETAASSTKHPIPTATAKTPIACMPFMWGASDTASGAALRGA
jgi:hypothetical protein